MFFILRKKFQRISIVLLVINLLAFSHQPDFKDILQLAERGDSEAQAKLGELYVEGEVVPQNYKKAFEWFSKAAQQGNSQAQLIVGMMYFKGEGVQQNNELAEKWLRKAAENGNKDALSLFEE